MCIGISMPKETFVLKSEVKCAVTHLLCGFLQKYTDFEAILAAILKTVLVMPVSSNLNGKMKSLTPKTYK